MGIPSPLEASAAACGGVAGPRDRAQGGELRHGRRGQHRGRLQRLLARLFLFRAVPIIAANVIAWMRRRHQLLRDELADHLRGGIRAPAAPEGLRNFAASQARRADRQHHDGRSWRPISCRLVLAKMLAIGASFVVNFSLSHFVVFRQRENAAEPLINGRGTLAHDENLTAERPTFVTHLECSYTGERYPADEVHNLSRAGKPLLVRYDLDGVRKALSKDALARRPADLWRYRELLPVRRAARHRQPRRGDDAADAAAASLPQGSAAASSSSRTRAGCRPARSRRAAWSWRCRWRRRSASSTWRCRPTAMPARRSPPMRAAPASRPRSSARRTRRR